MPKKKLYAVEITFPRHGDNYAIAVHEGFLDCLRYAGVGSIVEDNDDQVIFRLECPHTMNTEEWAKMNAQRIKTFGFQTRVVESRRST